MKSFERFFLYSVIAILAFHVFLVDDNVESQVAIQEEIRARHIAIVNDVGRKVVELGSNDEGNGLVLIHNGVVRLFNKEGGLVAEMRVTKEESGEMVVGNKNHKLIGKIP